MDTFRLTYVPDYYKKDGIRTLFSATDQELIFKTVSLATSVYRVGTPTKVATISFREPPSFVSRDLENTTNGKTTSLRATAFISPETQEGGKRKRIEIDCLLSELIKNLDPNAQSIRIDNTLKGLTPLLEPEGNLVPVELVAS